MKRSLHFQEFLAVGSELASHLDDIHPALDERGVDNGRMAGSALVEQSAVQVVELPREQVLVGTVDAIHGRAVERLDETAVVGLDILNGRRAEDGCLSLCRRAHALDAGPAVATPLDAVEIGDTPGVYIIGLETMIEHPCLPFLVFYELRAVAGTVDLGTLVVNDNAKVYQIII